MRGVRSLSGGVLVAVALVGVWPVFGLSWLFVGWIFGERQEDDWPQWLTDRLWLTWLVVTSVTIAAYVIGIRLIRGQRRTVLFLRRFGYGEATEVMTKAVRGIGGYWRVITLDDARVEAIGYSADAVRRFTRMDKLADGVVAVGSRLLGLVGTIALGAAAIYGFGVWRTYRDSGEVDIDFEALFTILQVGIAVWAGVMVVLLLRVVLVPFFAAASAVRDEIVKAEHQKEIRIDDATALPAIASSVRDRTRKVISPRLIVLRVATPIWQEAVTTFASVTTLSLVDVSVLSENILWEIEQLQRKNESRCVYVGRYDLLGTLYQIPEPGSLEDRVQQRLAGVSILAYTSDSKGVRRFTRALEATLDDHANRVPL